MIVMANFCFNLSEYFFLHLQTFILRQKYPTTIELEIDTIGKWSVRVVYIAGISTALCAMVIDAQVFLVKIITMG